jgi:hypothetical protein
MPNFPDNFNQSPSSPARDRRQRPKPNIPRQPKTMASSTRPPVAPPPVPEPIYEPPINFRENSPRLYGPCGTIRYAQPDGECVSLCVLEHCIDTFFVALKSKADPPRIQAELVRILEPLGSGEFGDVLLVEAPISAFPADSINLDLPKGAKDCLAALKRLKTNSSTETKETFLACQNSRGQTHVRSASSKHTAVVSSNTRSTGPSHWLLGAWRLETIPSSAAHV